MPSRDDILAAVVASPVKLNLEQLLKALKLEGGPDVQEAASRRARAMLRDGQLYMLSSGEITPIDEWTTNMTTHRALEMVLADFDLPHEWNKAVAEDVLHLPTEVLEKEKEGRLDIRKLPLVTIDGEDAKDFDDAVHCEAQGDQGWTLTVAIADVAHYVLPGSPIDMEALARGTSTYCPEHVVPMLPEELSNGLCSLRPNEDRLCMVCEMHISADGELSSYKFSRAVMHSHARLLYDQVHSYLEGEGDLAPEVASSIKALRSLFDALEGARRKRGALEFESIETMLKCDEAGHVEEVVPYSRNVAHKMIEEAMLLTNVAIAKFLAEHNMDALYRVHDVPEEEALGNLAGYLKQYNIEFNPHNVTSPKPLSQALEQVKKLQGHEVFEKMMLRSLKQAVYTPDNAGHFGLGYNEYMQFTSPIRRYPDLIAHRALYFILDKTLPGAKRYDYKQLTQLGYDTSDLERRAESASRAASAQLKCAYLSEHRGKVMDATISGVVPFGFFVTLNDLHVDGLVHVSLLRGDYYTFDELNHQLVGQRNKRVFKLGQAVKVKLDKINFSERKIDFFVVD
jgi:ribonuclease R